MGLVMQEPTLFNYTVLVNILYGKPTATNQEVRDAVQASNAAEFIESDELADIYNYSTEGLIEAMEKQKQAII